MSDDLVQRALEYVPEPLILPPPSAPYSVALAFLATFHENAEQRLLRSHRGDFYRWEGRCWPEAEGRGIRQSLYGWLEQAVYQVTNGNGDIELRPWSPTRHKISDVVDALHAAAYLEGSIEAPAWLDGEDLEPVELIPVANGILHVPSRKLLEHAPHFWIHHSLPYDYDPNAAEPERWKRFLRELWDEDPQAIDTLQEVFGYVLSTETNLQKMFLAVGPKRGGKGTIGRVIGGLLGKHNCAAPTLSGLTTNFGLAPLIRKPLAIISDARLSSRADSLIAVERLLSISGEDMLTVDRKYRDPWTGHLPCRFLILTNELPRLQDSSGALASRFVILVLRKSFFGRENPKLTNELLAEAPSILNWSLEGLDRLNERGHFVQPASGADALQQLEDLSSPVGAFVRDRCERRPEFQVGVDDLWQAWRSWSDGAGVHHGSKAAFGKDLHAAVPEVKRIRPRLPDRTYVYAGIRLREQTTRGWS